VTGSLIVSSESGVVCLTLNRPERRNALSRELLDGLDQAITSIAGDWSTRVVVIAANGPVFSAGHDLSELSAMPDAEQQPLFELCTRVMLGLRRLPQPVVGKVQGLAPAAGCQLVAACDLAVASETASFATPGVKIGLFCTTPMVPLVRAIPPRVALEMLMTAEPISAHRAREVGLVNRVVPPKELDAAVHALCDSLLAQSPRVLAQGKRAFYELQHLDEATAYERATAIMSSCVRSDDAKEGIRAFFEKRAPRWSQTDS